MKKDLVGVRTRIQEFQTFVPPRYRNFLSLTQFFSLSLTQACMEEEIVYEGGTLIRKLPAFRDFQCQAQCVSDTRCSFFVHNTSPRR